MEKDPMTPTTGPVEESPQRERTPREIAEETLQSLLPFTENLETMCLQASEGAARGEFADDFLRLVDGIEVFTDALHYAKQILRIAQYAGQPNATTAEVGVLEADMASIFRDVLHYRETGQQAYVAELLRDFLPRNLTDWRTKGIPALIRSRDS